MSLAQASSTAEKEALVQRLDTLLERYLNLLHEYEISRSGLSDRFSDVGLSLSLFTFPLACYVLYIGQGLTRLT